jgi:virulence-associated protein VagC
MTVSQEDTQPFSPLPARVVRLSECGFSHTVELHLDGSRLVIEPF